MKTNSLPDFFAKNKDKDRNKSSHFVRIFIYSGIFINLIIPFYNYQTNSFGWWGNVVDETTLDAEAFMKNMNDAQAEFYLNQAKFSNSIQELTLDLPIKNRHYHYRILSPMVPVQSIEEEKNAIQNSDQVIMVAQSSYPQLNSYIGMVATLKEKNNSKVNLISTLCKTEKNTPLPSLMPIVVKGEIQCPQGSQKVG